MADNALRYLTPGDWALINAKARRCVFKLGEEIIRPGALGDAIYILRKGTANVEFVLTQDRAVVATLGPEDVCGDMAFLAMGKATAAVIAADTEVEADEVRSSDLRDLFDAFPRVAHHFYLSIAVVLAHRLRDRSRDLAREIEAGNRSR